MTSRRARLPLLAVVMAANLTGCGGGGDSGPSPPPPNLAPVLVTNAFSGTEDTPLTGQLLATDPENSALTFVRTTDALHGQVTISATGSVDYIPAPNYSGQDTFGVRVTDVGGAGVMPVG